MKLVLLTLFHCFQESQIPLKVLIWVRYLSPNEFKFLKYSLWGLLFLCFSSFSVGFPQLFVGAAFLVKPHLDMISYLCLFCTWASDASASIPDQSKRAPAARAISPQKGESPPLLVPTRCVGQAASLPCTGLSSTPGTGRKMVWAHSTKSPMLASVEIGINDILWVGSRTFLKCL